MRTKLKARKMGSDLGRERKRDEGEKLG